MRSGFLTTLAGLVLMTAAATAGWAREAGEVTPKTVLADIRDFGAVDGDRTLVDVDHKVGSSLEFSVKRQTRTGKAIQDAIDHVGNRGGGRVFVPAGTWYIYSYLQVKQANVELCGEGASSVLKACPDAPLDHGYGILILGFAGNVQPKEGFTGLAVSDLKFDGSIYQRGRPKSEFQLYNLAAYGDVARVRIQNVVNVDSGIDCLLLCYGNNDESGVVVSDCLFKGAFRNTASFVAGRHIKVRDCVFEDGGFPFGGTNPRYCLDIEPDDPTGVTEHIQISGSTFRNAHNVAVGAVWCKDVRFTHCLFLVPLRSVNRMRPICSKRPCPKSVTSHSHIQWRISSASLPLVFQSSTVRCANGGNLMLSFSKTYLHVSIARFT